MLTFSRCFMVLILFTYNSKHRTSNKLWVWNCICHNIWLFLVWFMCPSTAQKKSECEEGVLFLLINCRFWIFSTSYALMECQNVGLIVAECVCDLRVWMFLHTISGTLAFRSFISIALSLSFSPEHAMCFRQNELLFEVIIVIIVIIFPWIWVVVHRHRHRTRRRTNKHFCCTQRSERER